VNTNSLKAAVRKSALERRRAAKALGRDDIAQKALIEFLAQYKGKILAGYMPINTEIDPLPVMTDWAEQGGQVVVPIVPHNGGPLTFHLWTPDAEMKEGAYGAQVPVEEVEATPDIIIVPMLAFDRSGNRLGYGGGYYDKTLAHLRAANDVVAIGFAFSAQRAAALPVEDTDQQLDVLVTETCVRDFRAA